MAGERCLIIRPCIAYSGNYGQADGLFHDRRTDPTVGVGAIDDSKGDFAWYSQFPDTELIR